MVVFDATMLLLLLRPGVKAPLDPSTGKPVEEAEARLAHHVANLEKSKTRIVIATPALSELLVRAGPAGTALVAQIQKSAVFRIAPFDTRAAIELATMTHAALTAGEKRNGIQAPWSKVKFDRQIVAIAKVENATAIYSDDNSLIAFAEANGITAIRLADLPLPPQQAQSELPLSVPEQNPDQDRTEDG
jgi:hypothetical protein